METNSFELLAPAGDWDSLMAAVQNGADAVYLGGSVFNARKFAGNFDDAAMERAIIYCHARGVRVYVTFNTILLDRELSDALSYAAFLYEAGADALIVQDMGLVRMVRAVLPEFELHFSTQAGIHDENGLKLCESLHIRRAVLSRELSLARIRALHAAGTAVELECFAHGALCSAMSGVCLFSSMAGGRSGNRGACAQPCRKAYALHTDEMRHPLSLADLNMLFHVQEMRAAGIRSVKLEGRMKRAEYVAAMTHAYRRAIDGAAEEELRPLITTMKRVFERGDSTGYYYGTDVPVEARGVLSGADAPLRELQETYRTEYRKRPLEMTLTLRIGEHARLEAKAGRHRVQVEGDIVEGAQKAPDVERYKAQLAKLGDTPFTLEACTVVMPEPAYVAAGALNALRREAVQALYARMQGKRQAGDIAVPAVGGKGKGIGGIIAVAPDEEGIRAASEAGAEYLALAPGRYDAILPVLERLQSCRAAAKLLLQLPAADFTGEWAENWREAFESGLLDGGVAQHASQVRSIVGVKIASYLCNASNAQSIEALYALGFDGVTASLELNRAQLKDLVLNTGAIAYGYGRVQLMQLWHCPQRAVRGAAACKACATPLMDEGGRRFALDPVKGRAHCLTRVRNCDTLDILDSLHTITPKAVMLEFFDESIAEVKDRVHAAQAVMNGHAALRHGATRGHWARGLD